MATQFLSKGIPYCGLPPSSSLKPSPHGQQQSSPQDFSPNPTLQLPAPAYISRPATLSEVCRTMAQIICVILSIQTVTDQLLHLPLIALNALLLSQPIALVIGVSPLLQVPHPKVQVQSYLLSSSFSLLSFVLPSHVWIYIILSSGQGLPLIFSQCSGELLYLYIYL